MYHLTKGLNFESRAGDDDEVAEEEEEGSNDDVTA